MTEVRDAIYTMLSHYWGSISLLGRKRKLSLRKLCRWRRKINRLLILECKKHSHIVVIIAGRDVGGKIQKATTPSIKAEMCLTQACVSLSEKSGVMWLHHPT